MWKHSIFGSLRNHQWSYFQACKVKICNGEGKRSSEGRSKEEKLAAVPEML